MENKMDNNCVDNPAGASGLEEWIKGKALSVGLVYRDAQGLDPAATPGYDARPSYVRVLGYFEWGGETWLRLAPDYGRDIGAPHLHPVTGNDDPYECWVRLGDVACINLLPALDAPQEAATPPPPQDGIPF